MLAAIAGAGVGSTSPAGPGDAGKRSSDFLD